MFDLPRRPRDYAEVLRAACSYLQAAGREEARVEAEYLLAHVLEIERARLAVLEVSWGAAEQERYRSLIERCAAGEPVAYLEGSRGFFAHEFAVTSAVLIPRADSECLVEAASTWLGEQSATVLDLGTGSGALLLSTLIACPQATGIGVDRSRAALEVARNNARSLGLEERCSWLESSWLTGVRAQRADLILCNPPYIEPGEELGQGVLEHEPHLALFTPPGLPFACYEAVLTELPGCLRPGGRVYFEVGRGRADGVRKRSEEAGLHCVEIIRDLGGVERVVVVERSAV